MPKRRTSRSHDKKSNAASTHGSGQASGKSAQRIPQTSRQWCLELLEKYRISGELIRDSVRHTETKSPDLHQGAAWAERVILRQRMLDRVLREAVARERRQVEEPLWTLLRMGSAELLLGPHNGQHAAISETVELCRYFGSPQWAGFLNGALRGVQRLLCEENAPGPGPSAYPSHRGEYRTLLAPLFPDPQQQPALYLASAFSLPDELALEWTKRYAGDVRWQLGWSSLESPPLAIRVHRLAVEPEEWKQRCESAEIPIEPTDFPEAFRLLGKVRLSELPGFESGEIVIQDLTAMRAVRLLNPYPGQRVLDLCAGPGTKTTQLAEWMLDRGTLVATDVTQTKLDQIEENLQRLRITCAHVCWIERDHPEIPHGPFDAVLVDAPCSNTGVLGKRPEARWRYSTADLEALNELQRKLLDLAASQLAEEGRIVYSTCSIEPRENNQLIEEWLQQHPEFSCTAFDLQLPTPLQDGGFSARLERQPAESVSES